MICSDMLLCKLPSIVYFTKKVVDWQQQLSVSAQHWEEKHTLDHHSIRSKLRAWFAICTKYMLLSHYNNFKQP